MRKWWAKVERHLTEDYRRWHKWASVRWALALVGLDLLQDYLPALKDYLPAGWVKYMALAIIVARVLRGRGGPPTQAQIPPTGGAA